MINFEELIKALILPLVAYPNDVTITINDSNPEDIACTVLLNKDDVGRVIGKGGMIAKAIRTILYAGASKEGKKIHLDINGK